MAFYPYTIYDGYDGTAGFTTPWIDVKNAFAFSISVVFKSDAATNTGTPAGTLKLLCSNEPSISAPMGGLTGRYNSGIPTGVSMGGVAGGGLGVAYAGFGEQPKYNGLDATVITQPVTSVQTVSGTGTVFYDLAQRGFRWVQVQYASTGTGAVNLDGLVKW